MPFETAYRIDRALAEAGMRAKGKGRNHPDVTRKEGLIFLVASLVVAKSTKAADETVPWLSALGKINKAPVINFDEEWDCYDEEEGKIHRYYNALNRELSDRKSPEGAVTFIDFLGAQCSLIDDGIVLSSDIQLTVSFTDLSVEVAVNCTQDDEFREAKDTFLVNDPLLRFSADQKRPPTGIKRKCAISGLALKEIIDRT